MTSDEKLMGEFFRISNGDVNNKIDIRIAAKNIGLKETALKNIVKHLAQANFVIKVGETHVRLTKNGCQFVVDNELSPKTNPRGSIR